MIRREYRKGLSPLLFVFELERERVYLITSLQMRLEGLVAVAGNNLPRTLGSTRLITTTHEGMVPDVICGVVDEFSVGERKLPNISAYPLKGQAHHFHASPQKNKKTNIFSLKKTTLGMRL